MSPLRILGGVVVLSLAAMMPAPARAVTHDKLAYLSFSAPVQIPGVTLNAGTYRFHLTNPDTSRNVLQVLSNDGAVVYAMFHTIPDARSTLTDDPTVSFRETPEGVPPAVKSIFYGGEYRGYEFVYPTGGPIMTAAIAPQPEVTYTPIPAAVAAEPAEEAVEEFETVAEPVFEPAVEPYVEAEAAELPRTGSALPLLGAGGVATLFAGLALALLRRRA
jgi:LPXTG-motif cell wall-anchored protein